jgi:hypothetical protein
LHENLVVDRVLSVTVPNVFSVSCPLC